MLTDSPPKILLATHDPSLQTAFAPVLIATGANVHVVDSGQKALSAIAESPWPALVFLDAKLPGIPLDQLLALARASAGTHAYSIVLIADTVSEAWQRRLAEGVLDDLIPRSFRNPHWRLRLDVVLRHCHRLIELYRLREASQESGQYDNLLGIYNRAALLGVLFRETDRAQRLKTALTLLLFGIDDFDHWLARLGKEACDRFLQTLVERTTRLLRSYDTFGRAAHHQFLVILPGCSMVNAAILAERIRMEVFSPLFQSDDHGFRLSACFGIASSEGRSPVVVLGEAETALQRATQAGPESIRGFGRSAAVDIEPVEFFSEPGGALRKNEVRL